MDIELKHLGQTLAIGGLAVYGVLFLVRVCRTDLVPKFFGATEDKFQLQQTAVYLALIFGAGILLEDVSKNFVAERPGWFVSPFQKLLGTDKDLRFSSLFSHQTYTNGVERLLPSALLCETLQAPPPHAAVAAHYNTVKRYVTNLSDSPAIDLPSAAELASLKDAINNIYYDAKNRVYRQDNYFSELSDMANRLHFTRAFAFLCYVFATIYAIFGLWCFAPRLRSRLGVSRPEQNKILILAVIYISGALVSRMAYRSEHVSYDLRVFGYSRSLLIDKDDNGSKKGPAHALIRTPGSQPVARISLRAPCRIAGVRPCFAPHSFCSRW